MEIFDDVETDDASDRDAGERASTRKNANYGGSGVDIFDDDDDEASTSRASSSASARSASAALAAAEPLEELEDIIRVRGYDPARSTSTSSPTRCSSCSARRASPRR